MSPTITPCSMMTAFSLVCRLLYVALSRARDRLLLSGLKPRLEFLDDLPAAPQK